MTEYTVTLADGRSFGPVDEAGLLRWAGEGRVPPDAVLVGPDGARTSAGAHPALQSILQAPPTRAVAPTPAKERHDGVTALIPYRNPAALVGYYVSVASLIPVFGMLLGPIAVVLGLVGIQKRRESPRRRGLAHAIVAVVLGLLTTIGNIVLLLFVAGAIGRATRF